MAQFETKDREDEDLLDATPRPIFTPAPLRRTMSMAYIPGKSTPEPSSDVEMVDDKAGGDADFQPVPEEDSATEPDSVTKDDTATEDDDVMPPPPQPPKKKKKVAAAKEVAAEKKVVAAKKVVAKGDGSKGKSTVKGKQPALPEMPEVSLRDAIKAAQSSRAGSAKSKPALDNGDGDTDVEVVETPKATRPKPRKVLKPTGSQWDNVPVPSFMSGGSKVPALKLPSREGEGEIKDKGKSKAKAKAKTNNTVTDDRASKPSDQKHLGVPMTKFGYVLFSPSSIMLSLDQTTLFYWSLSNSTSVKRKHDDIVNDWAITASLEDLKNPSRPPSKAETTKTTKSSASRGASAVPSLTNGSTRTTARSVLTNDILITGTVKPKIEVHKPVLGDNSVIVLSDGGLSNNDETIGLEREEAILSPPKGKRRATSSVSTLNTIRRLIYLSNAKL